MKSYPAVKERISGRVLDFGCNVGWLTQLMRRRYGATSIGVDTDNNAIKLGRFLGVKGLIPIADGNKHLPFKDGYFDTVMLKSILDCPSVGTDDAMNIISEASRVTKLGGIVLIAGELGYDERYHKRSNLQRLRTKSPYFDMWVRINTVE